MISIEEACIIATGATGYHYVVDLFENNEGFIVSTSSTGEEADESPLIVYKKDGTINVYFPPDHHDEEIKKVNIPEKFRY